MRVEIINNKMYKIWQNIMSLEVLNSSFLHNKIVINLLSNQCICKKDKSKWTDHKYKSIGCRTRILKRALTPTPAMQITGRITFCRRTRPIGCRTRMLKRAPTPITPTLQTTLRIHYSKQSSKTNPTNSIHKAT